VIHILLTGAGTTTEYNVCLDRLARAQAFAGAWMALIDFRQTRIQADAESMFQQAMALRRFGYVRLALCYLVESEDLVAIIHMMEEVFNTAGLQTTIAIRSTEEDALAWLDEQAERILA